MPIQLSGFIDTLTHLFTPRHTNNHRPRVLHPAGFAVFAGIILFTHSSLELVKLAPPQGFVLGYASNISETQILDLTNKERAKLGLVELRRDPNLDQAARAKATDMFANDYWAHISPDGTTPWFFIKGTGYKYTVAGENLARDFDTTAPMVQAWMDSPTHKANIVHQRYLDTGIAVVDGHLDGVETTLVVQMFGAPSGVATAPAPQTRTPSITSQALETSQLQVKPGQAVLSQTESGYNSKPLISPLDIKTSIALAIIIMIMAVLIVDEVIIKHKKTFRFVGRNLAHISFLGLVVLLILTLSVPGGIL